jgi:hypothetical protein
LIQIGFNKIRVFQAFGLLREGRDVAPVLELSCEGPHDVYTWFQAPKAVNAAVVGFGTRGQLRRAGIAIGDHIEVGQADIVFVADVA